ncbi:hypothetical protein BDV32DRAFT_115733 [Aspergillus pseudonomiae]|nr:hypothetical protein BDV32DRAFT_115733 [Aspergillus pseudonomiae]
MLGAERCWQCMILTCDSERSVADDFPPFCAVSFQCLVCLVSRLLFPFIFLPLIKLMNTHVCCEPGEY